MHVSHWVVRVSLLHDFLMGTSERKWRVVGDVV